MTKPSRPIAGRFPSNARERVFIEQVRPEIDGGRYPIKRTIGEKVVVTAAIFADGHDTVAAKLLYKQSSESEWHETEMRPAGNDLWEGTFTASSLGAIHYTVEGWIDRFATWRQELIKRVQAGQDVAGELPEGGALISEAAKRATGNDKEWLRERAARLTPGGRPRQEQVETALDATLLSIVSSHPDRTHATRYDRVLEVWVDRERARFGSWYEMFPRSAGPDPKRSATFREAESRLPDIAAMGFNVLYLPPIHPIGKSGRKGPNNNLRAAPGDPGSPWAIGSEEGGHQAIEPGLGTLDDFKHFVGAASRHGLEVALDLAFQCSPDHPYVKTHPEWFRHRPDGSIKYAENPPKKYQDVYPLNFEGENWEGLWTELKETVFFWIAQGVRIFRVDNPHTKPIRFWEWLIHEVHQTDPDVLFLAEAFTRPKVMYALAKVGFTQSYTYFTWRNSRWDLVDYFTELTQTEAAEYFRPNLFANTPDILHEYLQFGGKPAFQARLALAATLGANYGIYSGFELCEAKAVPGTEEYRDSEKYQIRSWDWDRPGNIKEFIARVNQIRRDNPALHSDRRLRFHSVSNEQLICFTKTTEDLSNIIFVVVNLDPYHLQEGWVELPVGPLGLAGKEGYQMHDLLSGARYFWRGEWNFIRLDPAVSPAHLFLIRRKIRTEKDFDYFM